MNRTAQAITWLFLSTWTLLAAAGQETAPASSASVQGPQELDDDPELVTISRLDQFLSPPVQGDRDFNQIYKVRSDRAYHLLQGRPISNFQQIRNVFGCRMQLALVEHPDNYGQNILIAKTHPNLNFLILSMESVNSFSMEAGEVARICIEMPIGGEPARKVFKITNENGMDCQDSIGFDS